MWSSFTSMIFLSKDLAFGDWERYSHCRFLDRCIAWIVLTFELVTTLCYPENIRDLQLSHPQVLHLRKRTKYCHAAAGACKEHTNTLWAGARNGTTSSCMGGGKQRLGSAVGAGFTWCWNCSSQRFFGVKVPTCPKPSAMGPWASLLGLRATAASRGLGVLDG